MESEETIFLQRIQGPRRHSGSYSEVYLEYYQINIEAFAVPAELKLSLRAQLAGISRDRGSRFHHCQGERFELYPYAS